MIMTIAKAVYAIEMSKPSFAMTLTSTAFRLCQTLGYHRSPSLEKVGKAAQGNMLFWAVYILDKAVSLRLGRASTIQDYDITSLEALDMTGINEPFKSIYPLWVKLATIQGQTYELLYSPAALAQPESERISRARQLASEMQQMVMKPFEVCTLGSTSVTTLIPARKSNLTRYPLSTKFSSDLTKLLACRFWL